VSQRLSLLGVTVAGRLLFAVILSLPYAQTFDGSWHLMLLHSSRSEVYDQSSPIFEQYGLISAHLENAILDNFTIQLLNDPELTGKVILRRGQYSQKFATTKLLRIKNYILKHRHVPANRISSFEIQRGKDFSVELYLSPKAKR
jgi:hypothetical protein